MLKLNAIVGYADDPVFAGRLQALSARHAVETVTLSGQECPAGGFTCAPIGAPRSR